MTTTSCISRERAHSIKACVENAPANFSLVAQMVAVYFSVLVFDFKISQQLGPRSCQKAQKLRQKIVVLRSTLLSMYTEETLVFAHTGK